jgi:diacylglycerol kinase (ATP)
MFSCYGTDCLPIEPASPKKITSRLNTNFCIFINKKSGGLQGQEIMKEFSDLENCFVFDLENYMGLSIGDQAFDNLNQEITRIRSDKECRFVVGGGDGTIAWLYEILDLAKIEKPPACAILPLGVGNELSRCVGWSSQFALPSKGPNRYNTLLNYLVDTATGRQVPLDRWTIRFNNSEVDLTKTMLCFFSIGFDANIAHKFHTLRESSPHLTASQAMNKFWYFYYGLSEIANPFEKVSSFLELTVDGEKVELPSDLRTLQVFNIHSSADGVDFFGTEQTHTDKDSITSHSHPALNDGLLEVVGTEGVFHLMSTRAKLSHSTRLAQGKNVQIQLKNLPMGNIPCQLDGEAWTWNKPTTISITYRDQVSLLKGTGPTKNIGIDL